MNPILMTLGESIDSIFYSFDMWVFHFFGSMQNDFLTYVAKFFTTFGDEAFTIPIVILGIVLCFFKRTRKYGFTLIFAIAVGTIVTNVVVKPAVLRIRPYNTLQDDAQYWAWYIGAGALSEGDYSFPSGHTTAATETAIALFLCFRQDKKKIAWLFPAIALCTAGSRVYLMVHYASDVLGGIIVGVLAAIIGYYLMKLVMILFDKTKLGNIDAGKLFKKITEKSNGKAAPVVLVIVAVGIFLYAFIPSLSEGGEDTVRCAYDGDYDCYNAARLDDDYPAIDGERYCKIHWKELSGVE
ncbi:MAG: phosphatase PAP2 family protein [Clostridiales bacterium]|nr:phosphatase PAP2 family protein [Clostridiales bacterium]